MNIADYPDLKSGKITGIDFDKYWYDNNDNIAADVNSVSVKTQGVYILRVANGNQISTAKILVK